MMKKTLVALAAVAATGATFAQSVLTGDAGFGYASSTSAASGTANGMGLTDADIYLAATEDVEGLGKVGVNLAIDAGNVTAAYGQSVVVGDQTMFIQLASGIKITMGAAKGSDYLSAIASAGSGYNQTLDNALFTSRTFTDDLKISIPVSEAIKLGITTREAGGGSGGGAASTGVGTQRDTTISLDYSNSGLVMNGGYRVYDGTNSTSTSIASSLTRASASYDLGVAKIGAGFVTTVYGYGNTRTDTLVGITAPVTSALSLGAQYGYRSKSGNTSSALNTNLGGSIISGSYTLSKRTSILASYMSYDPSANTTQTTAFAAKLFTTF